MAIRVVCQQPALPSYRAAIFKELAERPGIDLTLLYAEDPGISNVTPEGFDARHVPSRAFNVGGQPLFWHRAQFLASSLGEPDVAVLSWSSRYLSLVPALWLARRRAVGTVLWGHGYSKLSGGAAGLRAYGRRRITDLADAVMFYNRTAASAFVESGASKPDRVFVALNALNQQPIRDARDAWLDDPAKLDAFATEHHLRPGPNVVFVSRLYEDNRVDMLIDAMATLRDRFPHARTIIIGKGPDQPRLERLAAERGIADRVVFTGPIYDDEHLAPWMLCSAVFCYPVNIGLSILHAFGYSLPVVTSDRTDAQNPEVEALRPGENGAVYTHGSTDDLARVLGELLGDEKRRAVLAENARRTVDEDFNLKTMVDGMEAAIRYAAEKRTETRRRRRSQR